MTTNEKILLISYDFPPALAGVRRVVKFAKYLPAFGFEPVVLCANPAEGEAQDFETLKEVENEGYLVVRTRSLDPVHLFKRRKPKSPQASRSRGYSGKRHQLAQAISRWVFVPDNRIGWLPFAIPEANRIIRRLDIRKVITSSFPNSTHLVGLRSVQKHGKIRWLADFRDGWTQNPYFSDYPTSVHARLNSGLERRVVNLADAVTAVSEPIAQHLRNIADDPAKVHVIPNGYDEADFLKIEREHFNRFTIAYTGTLFMQRSPNLVFEAIAALRQDDPTLTQRLQLIFMTQFKPEHSFAIESLKLHEIVQNRGLGPYRDALKLQASADALLVLEGVAQNVEIMLTQKIFEYLAAEKPVLAIAPPGALADLINATGVGEVISPGDVTKIKEALKRLMNGTFHFAPDRERIATFSRRNQAGQLASILRHMK